MEVQGEDKRLKEIALRWEIEMQRSEVTGITLREQSHRIVHTELHLEPMISVHIVTNWLKQRTRETAKPLLSLDCLSCLRSVSSSGTLPPEAKQNRCCFSDGDSTSVGRYKVLFCRAQVICLTKIY